MSVRGTGTDLVELGRIAKLLAPHSRRFTSRCFRAGDLALDRMGEPLSVANLAGSWAAKEAFLKALGTDLRYIPYRDIELIGVPGGGLSLSLYGEAAIAARKANVDSIRVSITQTQIAALAIVVLET